MTTDRTPIRRWLAVGRRANRPPWSARKSGHLPIVAPLAVTLAATAAIGFGVVLVRAGEELRSRRRAPERGRRQGLGLAAEERLGPGLRRMALEQADVVVDRVSSAQEGDLRAAVHEARKAIKRLRTIVRLLEGELGGRTAAREQDALRAAAELLAGARDAEVLLETLNRLVERRPTRLAGRPGVLSLRLQLASEREIAERELLEPGRRQRVCEELRQFRARAEGWKLGEANGIVVAEPGLGRIYRQGRRRFRRAAAKHGGRMRTMHQWRKRVKDLRYAAEAMRRPGGEAGASGHAARRIGRLAKRADRLGEVLGEEHDLAVLGEWVSLHGAAAGAGRKDRRRLQRAIEERRKRLRRRALREASKLYRRRPKDFLRRARKAYRRSSPALSRR